MKDRMTKQSRVNGFFPNPDDREKISSEAVRLGPIGISGRKRWQKRNGSAVLIAIFVALVLSLIGLGFTLTAMTESSISSSGRWSLSTYYIAEAGEEEAIKKITTTPHSYFNPTLYSGSFPVDVTRCFYDDSNAPNCPVSLGTGSSLTSVPVAVGTGNYRVQVTYLGRLVDATNMNVHRYMIVASATLSNASIKSQQTVSGLLNVRDLSSAFPPHPMTSCTDPTNGGTNSPTAYISAGVVDPAGPNPWPGTASPNNGIVPNCSIPNSADLQKMLQQNADYSYPTSITDAAPLPPQFWKIPPTGNPPDPKTGEPYKVYINGDLAVNGNTTIYGIYYITGSIHFNGSASVQGVIYAPNGTMYTGNGGGNPNQPAAVGGIFAYSALATGNHYYGLWNPLYTNAYLGQLPQRVARGGR